MSQSQNKQLPTLSPDSVITGTTKSKQIITICKHPNIGQLPIFLNFAHRQLEKGDPPPMGTNGDIVVYSLPVDIFRLVLNQDRLGLMEDIEGLYVMYQEGK